MVATWIVGDTATCAVMTPQNLTCFSDGCFSPNAQNGPLRKDTAHKISGSEAALVPVGNRSTKFSIAGQMRDAEHKIAGTHKFRIQGCVHPIACAKRENQRGQGR